MTNKESLFSKETAIEHECHLTVENKNYLLDSIEVFLDEFAEYITLRQHVIYLSFDKKLFHTLYTFRYKNYGADYVQYMDSKISNTLKDLGIEVKRNKVEIALSNRVTVYEPQYLELHGSFNMPENYYLTSESKLQDLGVYLSFDSKKNKFYSTERFYGMTAHIFTNRKFPLQHRSMLVRHIPHIQNLKMRSEIVIADSNPSLDDNWRKVAV